MWIGAVDEAVLRGVANRFQDQLFWLVPNHSLKISDEQVGATEAESTQVALAQRRY
jgi:hypothetical protein